MKLFSSGRKTPTSSPASSHAGAMDETVGVTSTSEAANVATQPVPTPVEDVPNGVRTAAGWCWRMIVIAAFIYGLYQVLHAASEVSVPVAVALMLTAAMWPLANWLSRHHIHRGIASGICLLLLVILVGGVFTLVGAQIALQWRQLGDQSVASFKQALQWLAKSPLHTNEAQLTHLMQKAEAAMAGSQGRIASTAAAAGSQIGRFGAGLVMALFATFFFVYEGDKLAEKSAVLIPREHRAAILDAAKLAGLRWSPMCALRSSSHLSMVWAPGSEPLLSGRQCQWRLAL